MRYDEAAHLNTYAWAAITGGRVPKILFGDTNVSVPQYLLHLVNFFKTSILITVLVYIVFPHLSPQTL